ncbi:MAG: divergent polysaccharide deacetylase family protein, partial [Candidatus Krumholzibacteria bacterium]|nr:divergent polysaccharide deacetylase family protein [Candidatus Krumholzibacteria bacterium]
MNLFNRAFVKSLRRRKSGGKSKRKSGKAAATRKSRAKSSRTSRVMPWVLGAAVVVVVAGVGLLKWAKTGSGQATLLTLGSDKMFSEVQMTVEGALAEALPGFTHGPADATSDPAAGRGADHDWPAPQLGPGASVRCRTIPITEDITWWDLQGRVAKAVESRGARVLWAERLFPSRRLPEDQIHPNEEKDMLRMDVGVPDRPTHTLVLHRADRRPDVHWGGGIQSTAWSRLAAGEGPVVAIIIDDWGYSKSEAARMFLSLPAPVTMAILPGLSYSRQFALEGTDLVLPYDRIRDQSPTGGESESSRRQRMDLGCFVEVSLGSRERP